MRIICLVYLLVALSTSFVLGQKPQEDKLNCQLERQSRINLQIGFSDPLYSRLSIPETLPLTGVTFGVEAAFPWRVKERFFFTNFKFGRVNYNVHFNDLSIGASQSRLSRNSTDIYENVYAGIGIGKQITKRFKNNTFLRIPISLNLIYLPFVETFGEDGFNLVPFGEYSFDIQNNLDNKANFSIVPEISIEYNIPFYGCYSFNLGIYYSRGFSTAYEGSIAIQRVNGDIVKESFQKPFTSFGLSVGFGIYRAKNK